MDALRKVQGLLALANDEHNNEHERVAAQQKAVSLRLRYGISDQDLATIAEDTGDDFEFFGHRMFYFVNHIRPHLDRAKREINVALAKADELDLLNQASTYCRVYREVRQMLDGLYVKDQLKKRRDAVVKAYYQAEVNAYAEERNDPDAIMQHRWARERTAMTCDLPKVQVERIVGVKEDDLWRKQFAQPTGN